MAEDVVVVKRNELYPKKPAVKGRPGTSVFILSPFLSRGEAYATYPCCQTCLQSTSIVWCSKDVVRCSRFDVRMVSPDYSSDLGPDSLWFVPSSQLFRALSVSEDGCPDIPVRELPGESVEFVGRSILDDVIALTNYRLCLFRKSRMVINVCAGNTLSFCWLPTRHCSDSSATNRVSDAVRQSASVQLQTCCFLEVCST